MTARTQIMMAKAMMAAVLATPLAAQCANQNSTANGPVVAQQPAPAAAAKRVIVVSLEDRKLALVEDGKVKKIYPSRWASRRRRARWAPSRSSAA